MTGNCAMRIFISHGTDKSKDPELQFLDGLEQLLRQSAADGAPHDVLLDRTRLEAGDDWAGVLQDWLAECEVAILLLSPRAMQRPWVLKEATILAFRRDRDPAFPLLPILLPGVDRAAFDAHPGFSALALGATQAFAAGVVPAAVVDFVNHKLAGAPVPRITPLDRLQTALENRICDANAQALEQTCEDLAGEPVAWSAGIDRVRQRARVVARAIVRGRLGRLVTLTGMTKSLSTAALANEQNRKVLDLASSVWVEEEVAARLRSVIACRAVAPTAAALNSARVRYGARMAVWRAQLPDIGNNIYWVAGGGSDGWADEIVERICASYLEGNKDLCDDADDADDMLRARVEPVFFVIPPPLPDAMLLASLHQRYASAVFIAHTGDTLPATLPAHITALHPGLRLDLEKQNRADYLSAQEFIR